VDPQVARRWRLALAAFLPLLFASAAVVSAAPGAAATAGSATVVTASAAPSQGVINGYACPDVMVIAARGTNESPTTQWQDPSAYTGDQYDGAGQTLYTMYTELASASPQLKVSLDPVVYQTYFPSGWASLLNPGNLRYYPQYLSDANSGASTIALDIQATDLVCGNSVHYILAGYSLGAWAVHDALDSKLTRQQLGQVSGVALFGDPKFEPGQPFVRDFKSRDVHHGIAYYAIDRADNRIPASVVARTGSWCLPADPVCQFQHNRTWLREAAQCISNSAACAHFQYPTDGETLNAVRFLASLPPATSVWPRLTGPMPSNGTVGTPYSWTAAAIPARTYVWSSSGTLPPGLSFGVGGTLSGVPSQAGTYTFSITATDIYSRFVTGPVTVTIDNSSIGGGGASGTGYVSDNTAGTLTPVNLATGTAGTPIPVGQYPTGVVVTPDGTTAYVGGGGSGGAGFVTPVNLATGTAGTPIPVGCGPLGLAITPDGATVLVTNWCSGQVVPISTATNTAGPPIPVGNSPFEVAVTPDGSKAYVANCGSNSVTPINLATDTAGTPIPVGNCPRGVAVTPDGTTAYVTNASDGTVTPISLATSTPGTPIAVGAAPWGIAVTPDGATAYACDSGNGTVTPINVATGTAGAPIPVGMGPQDIAITKSGTTAYVTNSVDGTITPISTATNTPGTAITVATEPFSSVYGIALAAT
jgi:YVTN family beta-propeller protein